MVAHFITLSCRAHHRQCPLNVKSFRNIVTPQIPIKGPVFGELVCFYVVRGLKIKPENSIIFSVVNFNFRINNKSVE